MNTTSIDKLRSRLLFLAREVRTEAQHHKGREQFSNLVSVALQLAHLARSIDRQPVPVLEAAIDMAVGVIVRHATERLETL